MTQCFNFSPYLVCRFPGRDPCRRPRLRYRRRLLILLDNQSLFVFALFRILVQISGLIGAPDSLDRFRLYLA